MANLLEQLRDMTVVVADTGELEAVKRLQPVDCTTNPSLVLGAINDPASEGLIAREIEAGKALGKDAKAITDTLTVAVGAELAALVPGRVSTEVDAGLSYDTAATVARAHEIVADYAARGVGKERILIKIASTWEGIKAAEILQKEGIDCNLTLLFSLTQAAACADAGAFLISPFVGRITDWFKKAEGVDHYDGENDPGVKSVRKIYNYYKSNGINTVVMGASFRNIEQITSIAGCDRLTISPALLDELAATEGTLERKLSPENVTKMDKITLDEASFKAQLEADKMAYEKTTEGIEKFDADHKKLIALIAEKM